MALRDVAMACVHPHGPHVSCESSWGPSSNRLWVHRRWLAGGGMVELEDQPRAAPEERDHTPPPLAHGQVAVLIEQLEAEDDDDMDDDSDSEL